MADLKKLKKAAIEIFWKEKEQPSLEPIGLDPTLAPLSPVTAASPAPAPAFQPATAPVEVDQTFYKAVEAELNKAIDPDSAEFYNQMAVINEKFPNLDEPTRYQLAFHAAQTAVKARGVTLTFAGLLKTLDRLNQVIDVEKRDFKLQNEQGYQDNLSQVRKKSQEIGEGIQARESRLQAIEKELESFIAARNAEKKKLEEERSQLISQRVVVESEINQLEQKKSEREIRFNAALDAHQRRLDQLRQNLQMNLKSVK